MLSKYFCLVNTFIYSIKGKPIKLNPDMITSIEIIRDLFGSQVNKMEVASLMPRKNILEIIENYSTTVITLEILEIEKDKEGKVLSKNVYIKKTFDIIPAEISTANYRPQGEHDKDAETMNEPMPFIFHLYNKPDVNFMTANKNIQLLSATSADALYAMLQLRYVSAGLTIAQKPVSNTSHPSLILETSDLNNNLKELNERYGLYAGSPYAFKDYDYLYILDKYVADPMITIPGEATLMTFHLKHQSSTAAVESGFIADTKKLNDNINFVGTPSISDLTDEMSHIQKNNIVHVNPSSGVQASKKINDKGGSKLKVVISSNPSIVNKDAIKLRSLSKNITISVDNVPPSKFKPYKVFNFKKDPSLKDIKLEDKYKMSMSKIQLLKASDSLMVPTVTLKLIRA